LQLVKDAEFHGVTPKVASPTTYCGPTINCGPDRLLFWRSVVTAQPESSLGRETPIPRSGSPLDWNA
jgi:hypothetical protein